MAYLYRLILLGFVGLFFAAGSAHATFPAKEVAGGCEDSLCRYWGWRHPLNGNQMSWTMPSAPATCAAMSAYFGSGTCTINGSPPTSIDYTHGDGRFWPGLGSPTGQTYPPSPTTYQCPSGATQNGTTCTCNSPLIEGPPAGGFVASCVPASQINKCSTLSGQSAGNFNGPGGVGMKQLCDTSASSGDPASPGCLITGQSDFAASYGGSMHWSAPMSYTGAKCAPDPNGSTDAGSGSGSAPGSGTSAGDATQCAIGKVPGQVNGVTVCVDPGTSTPTKTASTKTNTTTNPDGTTTTQQQTTTTDCGPTGCTTTTTTTTTNKDATGNTTGTSTTSNSGTCTAGSPGCSPKGGDPDPSRFGGACAAGFSCDGDAIFCSMALEQHRRDCALFDTPTEESALYVSEKGKTGPQYQSENVNASANITPTNLLGVAGTCQLNKTVTIWGREVTLPFSQVCDALSYMGTLLLMVSFLLAYRIVSRG